MTKKNPAAPPVVQVAPSREERLVAWISANRTWLMYGAGAVLAVVAVTWFLSVSSARKEAFARSQLEAAWNAQDAGNLPLAASEMERIVTSYRDTKAALEAVLSLNQVRLLNGQSQLAVDDLQQFLSSNPPAATRAAAQLLLGAGYEDLGRHSEAAAAYQTAAEQAVLDFEKAEALLAAARAHRNAGNREAAITALQTILDRYPESASYPAADIRLGEMTLGR